MKLHVIFGQRKERYLGEYAPEVLAAMDEVGNSDNPDYLADVVTAAKSTDEFENVVVINIEVNGAQIMDLLRPTSRTLKAEIVS